MNEMYEIIGLRPSVFKAQDGTEISGVNLYVTYNIGKIGEGVAADRIYITTEKLARTGYSPKVGDIVNVSYNRWGKVEAVCLAD